MGIKSKQELTSHGGENDGCYTHPFQHHLPSSNIQESLTRKLLLENERKGCITNDQMEERDRHSRYIMK
jgi:hypothetical protein